jgi:hypothetical protein
MTEDLIPVSGWGNHEAVESDLDVMRVNCRVRCELEASWRMALESGLGVGTGRGADVR